MKGTIYWDESSRGYHQNEGRTPYKRGRWVGEKMVNGRRVRMRSSDYKKILQWLNPEMNPKNRMRLKDFPDYEIDLNEEAIYNKWGRVMKPTIVNGNATYCLRRNGERYYVRFNRAAYAVLHNISVMQIPTDIWVVKKDGDYILQHPVDFRREEYTRRKKGETRIMQCILSKRIREAEILQRYYVNFDATEIATYATMEIFDSLVREIMKRRYCKMERAAEIVSYGTEVFLAKLKTRNVPFVSISSAISSICWKVRWNKNQCELKEDYNYEREYN